MSLKQYAQGGGWRDSPVFIVVSILMLGLVLVGTYVFVSQTASAKEISSTNTTVTTIPRFVVDPDNAQSEKPFFPPLPPDDYEEGAESNIPTELPHLDVADYAGRPIPAADFEQVFPSQESRLTSAEFATAKEIGAATVTATVKGTGRERFPALFGAAGWPDPLSPDMVVDFVYAEAVPSDQSLVRTVVIWHGTSVGAEVTFTQVRVSQYLTRNAQGELTPVRKDALPEAIQNRDGLLTGVSIVA